MATGTLSITIQLDTSLLVRQMGQLKLFLEQMPERRARRFARKAYCLLVASELRQRGRCQFGLASHASDIAFQVRIRGMDELIAAAMRAVRSIHPHI